MALLRRSDRCLGDVFRPFLFQRHSSSSRTLGCSANRLQNKEGGEFFETVVAGLLVQAQGKESQDRFDVSNCCRKEPKAQRNALATIPFLLGRSRAPNACWKTLPYFGTRIRKNLVVEEGTINSEKIPLPMDPPAWKELQVDFSQSWQSVTTIRISTSIA